MTITAVDPLGLENVIGTAFADTLIGNSLNNKLTGGGGRDHLEGGDGDDSLQAHFSKQVFLDFDSETEPHEHQYSAGERQAILARLPGH